MQSPDPAKRADHGRRMALRRKYRVLSHYSGGEPVCSCCGETRLEFLALDHVKGGGTKHRRALGLPGGGYVFYALLAREGFPPGYRVLCHNCNSALGWFSYCPHASPERAEATLAGLLPRTPGRPPRECTSSTLLSGGQEI